MLTLYLYDCARGWSFYVLEWTEKHWETVTWAAELPHSAAWHYPALLPESIALWRMCWAPWAGTESEGPLDHWTLQKEFQESQEFIEILETHIECWSCSYLPHSSSFIQIQGSFGEDLHKSASVFGFFSLKKSSQPETCCGNFQAIYVSSLNGIVRMFHTVQHCKYHKRPVE